MTTPGVAASVQERAAEWALRVDGGNLSERDRQALADWLAIDPTHGAALEAAQRVWRELDDVSAAIGKRTQRTTHELYEQPQHDPSSAAHTPPESRQPASTDTHSVWADEGRWPATADTPTSSASEGRRPVAHSSSAIDTQQPANPDTHSPLASEERSAAITNTRSSSAFSETLLFSGSECVVPNAPSGIRRGRVAAAVIALACFAGVVFRDALSIAVRADARTAVGEMKTVVLEDGSRVQLNTNSAAVIRYTPRGREIELLAGEAAFDVAHDAARPFRVHFREGTTTAVGTAFQVRAFEEEAVVTVTEGRVEVRSGDGSLELHAGQQARYAHDGFRERAKNVDVASASAWQRGRVSFVDQPLGDVVGEIDRYHRGRIVILDDTLAEQRISGVFDINEPLTALATIERNLGLHSTHLTSYLVLLSR